MKNLLYNYSYCIAARLLQLLAGEIVEHQTTVAEGQLQHAALPAKLIFADGVQAEGR